MYFWSNKKTKNLTKKYDISRRKFKNIESPKMVSKRLYGHYLRSYEQIKKNRILTTKSHFPRGNCSKNSWWKNVSAPQKLDDFFKKVVSKNNDFISLAKTLKKFKNIESPKMVLKRLYGHYLRRYEQIKTNRILIVLFTLKKEELQTE